MIIVGKCQKGYGQYQNVTSVLFLLNLHGRKKESEDLDLWGNHLGGKQGNTSAIAYMVEMLLSFIGNGFHRGS